MQVILPSRLWVFNGHSNFCATIFIVKNCNAKLRQHFKKDFNFSIWIHDWEFVSAYLYVYSDVWIILNRGLPMVNSFEKGPKSSKRSSGINFITAKKEDKLFIEQLESGKHYTYADLIMQSGFHTWLNHQFFLWLALSLFGLNSRTCDDFIDAIAFHVFYTSPRFIIFIC